MSDASQGPGWWQASDGKWYPPEQAPGYQPPGAPLGGPIDGAGGTDIGSTLTYAFNKFIQNIGEWVVLWLIFLAAIIVTAFLGIAVGFGTGLGGFVFSPAGIFINLLGGVAQGIIYVCLAKGAVQATNGQPVNVSECFKLTSNNIMAGLVFGLCLGLANSFCFLIGIAVFLFLGFVPVLSAMDDKGVDALNESVNLTMSRSNETMLYWLISWFIARVVCGLGAPVAMIGGVYLVKKYRGEPVY